MTKSKKQSGIGRSKSPGKYSEQVKKGLAASSRTNQACDRCKVRKTKCDSLPGGCSECISKNEECITTDKVSGRSMHRGYVNSLEQRIASLEAQLKAHGIQGDGQLNTLENVNPNITRQLPDHNGILQLPHASNSVSPFQTNTYESSSFQVERTPDNYLGVSSAASRLSSIKGTALSIFGMKIDVADFESIDMDEPNTSGFNPTLYNKSYQAFLQSALNVNDQMEEPPLPPKDEAFQRIEWYFRVINPYIPFLHRPTFMALLTRRYDDPNFKPRAADNVMIHMAFAIMLFQEACRNRSGDGTTQSRQQDVSNQHYHYSLSKYYRLSCSHGVQDVQALTMICSHLRNFPKPGASWILTQHTLSRAFELNMHRSAKNCTFDTRLTALDIEMRKRIFWSLLTIHVTLSGKLGRPISIRMEDFDIEIPDAISDDQLTLDGINGLLQEKCMHKVGIHAFQIIPLYMELYSTIYAVRRRPEVYIATVNALEAKLKFWTDALSPELVHGKEQEDRVFTLYSKVWAYEFRLLLRHPSASMTNDESFNAESLDICAQSARKMLSAVRQIQKYNCLDTTWYNTAVYVMAITTTLFVEYERRDHLSISDLESLKRDMGAWLGIMGDVGQLLGSGVRLRDAVRNVVVGTLTRLDRSLADREKSRPKPLVDSMSPSARLESSSRMAINDGSLTGKPADYNNSSRTKFVAGGTISGGYSPVAGSIQHHQTPYPQSTQYQAFTESSTNVHQSSYAPPNNHSYNSKVEEASDLVRFARQANQAAVQPPLVGHQNLRGRQNPAHYSGPQAWNIYTAEAVDNFGLSDSFPVNALMQLGVGDLNNNGIGVMQQDIRPPSTTTIDHGQFLGDVSSISSWPQAVFDMPNQNQSS